MPTLTRSALPALLLAAAAVPAIAQEASDTDPRQIFNTEVCTVDDLTSTQCECAWEYLGKKLSARDLRVAMLIMASNADDKAVADKAYQALEKSSISDKRRDELAADVSALTVEAEDACPKP